MIEILTNTINSALAFILRSRIFLLSLVMTLVFYWPSLLNGSIDAGYLYSGDILGWYLPALLKTISLLSSFNVTAIDYSSYNGSSDFFLIPSSHSYHPMVVLYSMLIPANAVSFHEVGRFLVVMMAVHIFLACYFAIKLFSKFLLFDFGLASFVGAIFAFSTYIVFSHVQPPFIFAATLIPWTAYSALSYSVAPSFRRLIYGSLPVLCSFLGSYLPLGLASLALSMVLVISSIVINEDSEILRRHRFRRFFFALLPFAFASVIALPYLFSVYSFYQETPAAVAPSLFFSAHQMAEQPASLLRLISSRLSVPGPYFEFSLSWGLIALAIVTIFMFGTKTRETITSNEWLLFKVSTAIYFATVLAIYGEYSVASDLIYFFVPQVGTMHIYQRFLLPAHLLFAAMLALMLKAIVESRPVLAIKIVAALLSVAMFFVAHVVARDPALSIEMGLNHYIVFELLVGVLFAFVLLVPSKGFIYGATIVLFSLPALDHMYDMSHGTQTLQALRKTQTVTLDDNEKARLVSYIRDHFGGKSAIKYVDITPLWNKDHVQTFPKSFPYFVLDELPLSSYGGFMFYLSSRADFMRKMPVGEEVAVNPDWQYVLKSGADFVVARESDIKKNALLNNALALSKVDDILRLPNDVVIIPLRGEVEKALAGEKIRFENGVFRITETVADTPPPLQNIAVGKSARQSGTYDSAEAKRAIDGKTDGDYNHGSVSHTSPDLHAWLDVDLGQLEEIDSVRVWNRTDGSEFRLRDFWVFISEVPFLGSDTAATLQGRTLTWGKMTYSTPKPSVTLKTGGIRGRYVRVQLGGRQAVDQSFLTLAELEVFRSDHLQLPTSRRSPSDPLTVVVKEFSSNQANKIHLQFQASAPSTVAYLFWSNPRLRYYLNGQPAKVVQRDGLVNIDVPTGLNVIEVHYIHWPLRIFWAMYLIYALVLLWVSVPTRFQSSVRAGAAVFATKLANRMRLLASRVRSNN